MHSKFLEGLNKRLLPGFTSGHGWGEEETSGFLFYLLFFTMSCINFITKKKVIYMIIHKC